MKIGEKCASEIEIYGKNLDVYYLTLESITAPTN